MTGAAQIAIEDAMWPYHPDLLDSPVVRYTSFPTAAEFGELDADHHRSGLEPVEGNVSLYVHIRFSSAVWIPL